MNTDWSDVSLSIGIPTYNQASTLRETLDSLLNQQQPPHELVVCENHSTDQTPQILEEYGDQIRVVRPPQFLPMMANWNYLVSQLSGNWFALLSSDDVALPCYVETLTRAAARSPNAVFVRCAYDTVDGQLRTLYPRTFDKTPEILPAPENFIEQLEGPQASFAAFAAKKSAWEKSGGFPEEFQLMGDWGMWLRLSCHGEFILDRTKISKYRYAYRSAEKHRQLAPLWNRDAVYLFRDFIPEIARRHNCQDRKEIPTASRKYCYFRLFDSAKVLPVDQREESAQILADWARRCGLQSAWQRFRAGQVLRRKNYGYFRYAVSELARVYNSQMRPLRKKAKQIAGRAVDTVRDYYRKESSNRTAQDASASGSGLRQASQPGATISDAPGPTTSCAAVDLTLRQKLSVVIPCKDEERNILQCIASVREVADEIVVADSCSVDQTLEKVRQQGGCRIVRREFVSYSSFKNWAILQATHRWVLTLDADERLTPAAAAEIRSLLANEPPCDGYQIRRINHCLGRPLRYGPARRDWPLRLFRGDLASYNDRRVHESIQLVSDRVGKLRQPMLHFAYWSIADYARKGQLYADLAAEDLHAAGRRAGFFKLISAWPVRFFKCYFLQRGFLDGVPGLVHSLLSANYTMNKYLSLWSLSKQSRREQVDPEPAPDAKQEAA